MSTVRSCWDGKAFGFAYALEADASRAIPIRIFLSRSYLYYTLFHKTMETQYPYLVVRLMPAIYSRRSILFEADACSDKDLVIPDNHPYGKSGKLTKKARDEIISATLQAVKRTGFRMCAVFSKYSCVYCEPDGSTEKSNDCPDGTTILA